MTEFSPQAPTARSRSIALVSPYEAGKSTLFDELLVAAGLATRRARISAVGRRSFAWVIAATSAITGPS